MIAVLLLVFLIGIGAVAGLILLILALIFWKRRNTRITLLASAGACLTPLILVLLVALFGA